MARSAGAMLVYDSRMAGDLGSIRALDGMLEEFREELLGQDLVRQMIAQAGAYCEQVLSCEGGGKWQFFESGDFPELDGLRNTISLFGMVENFLHCPMETGYYQHAEYYVSRYLFGYFPEAHHA